MKQKIVEVIPDALIENVKKLRRSPSGVAYLQVQIVVVRSTKTNEEVGYNVKLYLRPKWMFDPLIANEEMETLRALTWTVQNGISGLIVRYFIPKYRYE